MKELSAITSLIIPPKIIHWNCFIKHKSMITKENCDLFKYNTMRLHSIADCVFFPESREELDTLIDGFNKQNKPYYIFSGGSNILFAERVTTPLINLMEIEKGIEYLENGLVKVGCSVRVQSLIRDLQKHGLGGIEYLFSVPSSLGGAVYMNAGRGKSEGLAISDYLVEVEYYSPTEGKFMTYKKKAEDFSHRHSPFQDLDAIIVSATFKFKEQDKVVTEALIKERMEHSKKYLSADKPSCGSVFCEGNRIVYRLLMGKRVGGAMYSKKTPDWISNMGNATASDVMALIEKGKRLHKLFFSHCKVEIRYIQ